MEHGSCVDELDQPEVESRETRASTAGYSEAACPEVASPVKHPYVFELLDETGWLDQLQNHGYVVIRGVGSPEQVAEAKELLWQGIEERHKDTDRKVPQTWKFPLNSPGIVPWLAQSAGAWAVRGWPSLKRVFQQIWKAEDLIVSMDCVLVWKPWWIEDAKASWIPETEGLHLDQNPFSKPGFECVQGMVPLLPVTEASGGLRVVPDSHLDSSKEAFKRSHSHMRGAGDWCPCNERALREQAVLLLASPGDLILWDSRTIHGGIVGSGRTTTDDSADLARLSVTVAMTPRAWASQLVQQCRRDGFEKGANFNHCPHESGSSNGTIRAQVRQGYKPVSLTPVQEALL